jgi:hypothetical protein
MQTAKALCKGQPKDFPINLRFSFCLYSKITSRYGVLCLYSKITSRYGDVVKHHHEPLQFLNTFNSHVCLLQILCMAVYRNIFLASGCLSKIFFEVRCVWSQITMVELFYPLKRMNQLYFYYKIFMCYSCHTLIQVIQLSMHINKWSKKSVWAW